MCKVRLIGSYLEWYQMTRGIRSGGGGGGGELFLLLNYAAFIDSLLRNVGQCNLGSNIDQIVQSILTDLSFFEKLLFVALHSI